MNNNPILVALEAMDDHPLIIPSMALIHAYNMINSYTKSIHIIIPDINNTGMLTFVGSLIIDRIIPPEFSMPFMDFIDRYGDKKYHQWISAKYILKNQARLGRDIDIIKPSIIHWANDTLDQHNGNHIETPKFDEIIEFFNISIDHFNKEVLT